MQYAKIDQKNARKLIAISFRIFDKVLKYAGVQKVETACKIAKKHWKITESARKGPSPWVWNGFGSSKYARGVGLIRSLQNPRSKGPEHGEHDTKPVLARIGLQRSI
jgi:hypothetical protein